MLIETTEGGATCGCRLEGRLALVVEQFLALGECRSAVLVADAEVHLVLLVGVNVVAGFDLDHD
jgi:hypothetical protein